MDSFLETWGGAINQALVLLSIVVAFSVGIAPQVGDRRRVENLKLGGETLALLTGEDDRRAVERFMARERFLLEHRRVLTGPSFVAMAVLVMVVVVLAPLVRAHFDPTADPNFWQSWVSVLAFVGVLPAFVAGRIFAKRWSERQRQIYEDAVPETAL